MDYGYFCQTPHINLKHYPNSMPHMMMCFSCTATDIDIFSSASKTA